MPLEIRDTLFTMGTAHLGNDDDGSTFDWKVYTFSTPRSNGQAMFWSMAGFYKYLSMTSYGKSSSTWVSRQKHHWTPTWTKLFSNTQLVEGTMLNGLNRDKKEQTPFSTRCLPEPSTSTLGVMQLMIHWSPEMNGEPLAKMSP